MSAKITLLQEDINQLPVDALVHCQYSQEDFLCQYNYEQDEQDELGQGEIVKITRPADAPWVADNMLSLKAIGVQPFLKKEHRLLHQRIATYLSLLMLQTLEVWRSMY